MDFLSLNTGLNSKLYPLACLPLGISLALPGWRRGMGFGMKKGMAEDKPFIPLALLWHPFLSACSSDLGFCFLPNTQPSWLPAQVREGERTYFLRLLSENNPAGTAQEQEVPECWHLMGLMSRSSCYEPCLCPIYPQFKDLCVGKLGGLQGLWSTSCLQGFT